jgi:hypothetical protein
MTYLLARSSIPAALITAACLGLSLGCGDSLLPPNPQPEGTWQTRISVFSDWYPSPYAPDTVQVGQEFIVTITTEGGGCVSKGHDDVIALGSLVSQITPYDRFKTGGIPCPTDVRPITHSVPLTFDTPGEGIVLIRGRTYSSRRQGADSLITIGLSVTLVDGTSRGGTGSLTCHISGTDIAARPLRGKGRAAPPAR